MVIGWGEGAGGSRAGSHAWSESLWHQKMALSGVVLCLVLCLVELSETRKLTPGRVKQGDDKVHPQDVTVG